MKFVWIVIATLLAGCAPSLFPPQDGNYTIASATIRTIEWNEIKGTSDERLYVDGRYQSSVDGDKSYDLIITYSGPEWLMRDIGKTAVVLEVNGQYDTLNLADAQYQGTAFGATTFNERLQIPASFALFRRIGDSRSTTIRIIGALRTLYRQFSPGNIRQFMNLGRSSR